MAQDERKAKDVRMSAPPKDDRAAGKVRSVNLGSSDNEGRGGRKMAKSVRLGTGGRSGRSR